MICPVCNGNEKMVEKDKYHVCPKCLTEVWPPEKPERGEYKKKEEISSPALMLWHKEDIDYKPPLPAGVPVYKGGGRSGRKRKKKPNKQITNINFW